MKVTEVIFLSYSSLPTFILPFILPQGKPEKLEFLFSKVGQENRDLFFSSQSCSLKILLYSFFCLSV
jgi:hypothetical protein